MDEKGVVLRSWRVGTDCLGVCVGLVEGVDGVDGVDGVGGMGMGKERTGKEGGGKGAR